MRVCLLVCLLDYVCILTLLLLFLPSTHPSIHLLPSACWWYLEFLLHLLLDPLLLLLEQVLHFLSSLRLLPRPSQHLLCLVRFGLALFLKLVDLLQQLAFRLCSRSLALLPLLLHLLLLLLLNSPLLRVGRVVLVLRSHSAGRALAQQLKQLQERRHLCSLRLALRYHVAHTHARMVTRNDFLQHARSTLEVIHAREQRVLVEVPQKHFAVAQLVPVADACFAQNRLDRVLVGGGLGVPCKRKGLNGQKKRGGGDVERSG